MIVRAQKPIVNIHFIIHARAEKGKPFFHFLRRKRAGRKPGSHTDSLNAHFWKVTPTTVTLTWATSSPLVFSTALNTAS